jgi:hypothetical protein
MHRRRALSTHPHFRLPGAVCGLSSCTSVAPAEKTLVLRSSSHLLDCFERKNTFSNFLVSMRLCRPAQRPVHLPRHGRDHPADTQLAFRRLLAARQHRVQIIAHDAGALTSRGGRTRGLGVRELRWGLAICAVSSKSPDFPRDEFVRTYNLMYLSDDTENSGKTGGSRDL